MTVNSIRRFLGRSQYYHQYRPSYPDIVLKTLKKNGLRPNHLVADIGTGTGIFAKVILENNNYVIGIEPNLEMRKVAQNALRSHKRFSARAGTAENTHLKCKTIDWITCAQSFHWFNFKKTKFELQRILKENGRIALVWNSRHNSSSKFMRCYEELLCQYGIDYPSVKHTQVFKKLPRFFTGGLKRYRWSFTEELTYERVRGRLLSTSYAPPKAHRNFKPMIASLEKIFNQYSLPNRKVRMQYWTHLFVGTF